MNNRSLFGESFAVAVLLMVLGFLLPVIIAAIEDNGNYSFLLILYIPLASVTLFLWIIRTIRELYRWRKNKLRNKRKEYLTVAVKKSEQTISILTTTASRVKSTSMLLDLLETAFSQGGNSLRVLYRKKTDGSFQKVQTQLADCRINEFSILPQSYDELPKYLEKVYSSKQAFMEELITLQNIKYKFSGIFLYEDWFFLGGVASLISGICFAIFSEFGFVFVILAFCCLIMSICLFVQGIKSSK